MHWSWASSNTGIDGTATPFRNPVFWRFAPGSLATVDAGWDLTWPYLVLSRGTVLTWLYYKIESRSHKKCFRCDLLNRMQFVRTQILEIVVCTQHQRVLGEVLRVLASTYEFLWVLASSCDTVLWEWIVWLTAFWVSYDSSWKIPMVVFS